MMHFLLDLFKKYPFERKRLILAALIGFLGIFAGMQYLFRDLSQIRRVEAQILESKKKQIIISEGMIPQNQVVRLRPALSLTTQPDWVIAAVNTAARESGLSLISILPQSSDKAVDFEKIALLIEARGKYHQVGQFLERVENHSPSILLSHLRLEKVPGTDSGRQLKIFALLSAFHETEAA